MILFRFFDFAVRVFMSFLFVFILQVQFDGKALESYLTSFSEKFFLTKALDTVGKDGVKIVRSFSLTEEQQKEKRAIANEKATQVFEELSKRISLPAQEKAKQE